MKRLSITPTLLTGHPKIDAQHSMLAATINQCMDDLEADDAPACAVNLIRMGDALQEHFRSEEIIMEQLKFKGLKSHQDTHIKSYQYYIGIDEKCIVDDCRNEECIFEMKAVFLEDIIYADMEFKPYLSEIDFRT